jgi:2-polyprenyl-3-methyl-5-hydroxy-6-metoxy-1,4-benzoquinol methylase
MTIPRASGYREFGYAGTGGSPASQYISPVVLAVLRDLPTAARVLDVGCGNGALAGQLIEAGLTVVGIDLSEEGIGIARDVHPQGRFEVMPADARMLEHLGEQPFDAIVSTEVIEHLYDPVAYLIGCREALRPGGRLVVSTPYHGYLKNMALAITGRWDSHLQPARVGGHIKFWSRSTLTAALEDGGFRSIEFHGAGRIPLVWKSMILTAIR